MSAITMPAPINSDLSAFVDVILAAKDNGKLADVVAILNAPTMPVPAPTPVAVKTVARTRKPSRKGPTRHDGRMMLVARSTITRKAAKGKTCQYDRIVNIQNGDMALLGRNISTWATHYGLNYTDLAQFSMRDASDFYAYLVKSYGKAA